MVVEKEKRISVDFFRGGSIFIYLQKIGGGIII